ncbi:hypothetical protein B5808_16610 [Cnuibacter physcomitrellae]|uniref:Type IV secretion protein Rhs n=1 Tax=Cnuibacter physcomitrellae TaxID=1619308 RepID=A0A1X9LN88_9MICO|nr:hypothetical protein [Cnuibacter physcomitrellae]ARJ06664.1 hypothetical protein B5808_16610 [Cnuibacter physcomitrellae]MCS5497981.1 hypothetical protein [Cnuibacter physcomitrellae]
MARKKTPREPNPMNPFDGKPGFVNRLNRIVFTFTGPAQVGIGRPEAPYVPPADPTCPICGVALAQHEIQRNQDSSTPTRLICPTPARAS